AVPLRERRRAITIRTLPTGAPSAQPASTSVGQSTPRYTRDTPTSATRAVPRAESRGAAQPMTAAAAALPAAWLEAHDRPHPPPTGRKAGKRFGVWRRRGLSGAGSGLYRDAHEGDCDAADRQVRKAREGIAGPRFQAVEQRAGPAHLRQHLAGRVEDVAGALQDGHERVPPRRRLRAGEPGALRSGRE